MSDEAWLGAMWQLVREQLPAAPARVVELGCGPLGGFVPELLAGGYDAVGVDPKAPEGERFRQMEFERFEPPARVDAVVACTSLHHVADPGEALEHVAAMLVPGGRVIVIEWVSEDFDEATARWCFERLDDDEETWLHRRRDAWLASGLSWDEYFRKWADDDHIHSAQTMVASLDARFGTERLVRGPFFFADLGRETSEQDEQAAIDAGEIRAGRVEYVGFAS